MGWMSKAGRVIRSNDRVETRLVGAPDPMSVQIASLGYVTNTFSPASAGIHSGGQPRGFTGDRGFGVNRFAGALDHAIGPIQHYGGLTNPLHNPLAQRVGLGAMTSGQPGFPNSSPAPQDVSTLAYLGYGQMTTKTGMS